MKFLFVYKSVSLFYLVLNTKYSANSDVSYLIESFSYHTITNNLPLGYKKNIWKLQRNI